MALLSNSILMAMMFTWEEAIIFLLKCHLQEQTEKHMIKLQEMQFLEDSIWLDYGEEDNFSKINSTMSWMSQEF